MLSAITYSTTSVVGNLRPRPTGAPQQQTHFRRRRGGEGGDRLQPLRLQIPEASEAEEVGSIYTYIPSRVDHSIVNPIYYHTYFNIIQAISSKCTTHVT